MAKSLSLLHPTSRQTAWHQGEPPVQSCRAVYPFGNSHFNIAYPAGRMWQEQVVLTPARQHFHLQLCIQAITCCRSSTSSFHIRLWSAASSERSAIFTARMTGSGERAWMTPITMTYLPATAGAGGQLLSDDGFKRQLWYQELWLFFQREQDVHVKSLFFGLMYRTICTAQGWFL